MESLIEIPSLDLKGEVGVETVSQIIKNKVLEELRKVNLNKFKLDTQLTEMIMQMVEMGTKKILMKIDKKQLVVNILKEYHALSPEDMIRIASQVQYVYDNKLIKKTIKPIVNRICNKITKVILNPKK